jgi:hypothetical protein
VFVSNAEYETAAITARFDFATIEWQRMLALVVGYRKLGIGKFLMTGSAGEVFSALGKSCKEYQRYLSYKPRDLPPASRVTPFADALACNDFTSATVIARGSRTACFQNHEYIDDFFFSQILFGLVQGAPIENLDELFRQLAPLETPKNSFLVELADGLIRKDVKKYEEGLDHYLENHFSYYETLHEVGGISDDDYCLKGSISIDALAFVRLGNWRGFEMEAEYRGVPSLLIGR